MPRIINFHDIYDDQWFENTLDVISEKFRIVPFSEIIKYYDGGKIPKNSVHLTIDDGHISTYSLIYPVLKRRGLNASIFVSPKIIRDRTNFWYFESAEFDKQQLKVCIAEVLNIELIKLDGLFPRSVMKTLSLNQNEEIIALYRQKFGAAVRECQYIDEKQLAELNQSGVFQIGAHTMNHPILANETDAQSEFEIVESVKLLSEMLDKKIDTFA
ncbi:MAG: polysaccharide deacetylase family protein [Weeksellaceae bacterium]|nr:polysaccharide deacetylase family protein [Weeksellaceae bacterium]